MSGVWDSGALNWVVNGIPSSAYTDGDVVTFDDSGSAANTISSGATVSPASVTVNTTLNSYTISAVIGGTAGLTKSGSSTLTLTGANTYTGATVVSGGTLILTNSGSLSSSMASLSISDGATLITSPNNSFCGSPGGWPSGAWTIAGTFVATGAGTQTMPANITLNNGTMTGTGGNAWWGTFLTGPAVMITANGANNTISATTLANYYDVLLNTPLSSDVLNVSSVIGGFEADEGGLYKLGDGTVTLTGASIYLGATVVEAGTLQIGDGTNDGSIATSSSIEDDANLVFDLAGNQTYGMFISGGGSLAKLGAGTLTLTGMTNTYSGDIMISAGTLQLGNGTGGNDGSVASASSIANNAALVYNLAGGSTAGYVISGSGSLTKAGPGILTLSGANTYTGATAVNGGTLLVNSPGSLASSSAVTVASQAVLGGNGTINGTVNVSAGGNLVPGGINTIGTLTLANGGSTALTLNGDKLTFALDNSTAPGSTYSQLAVAGQLTLNGANTIALFSTNGMAPAGTYTLMTYAAKTGSGTLALSTSYTNATLTVGATSVTLTVTGSGIPVPAGQTGDIWAGAVSGVWDGGALNWVVDGIPASAYTDGDVVTFDDSGSAVNTISSGATVSPASVTVNTTLNSYTISAVIGGTASLTKSGSSTLTLSGANTYTGATVISGGTLQLGDGTIGDDGSVVSANITNNSALVYNLAGGSTAGYVISGSGSLTKAGPGTLTLSGTNPYTGATAVNGGTLLVNSPGSLASSSAVTVASQAVLGGNGTINGTVNVSAGGSLVPGGVSTIGTLTLANGGSTALTLNGGKLTFVLDDSTAPGSTYSQLVVAGQLTLNGANTIALVSANGMVPAGTYTLMTYAAKTGSGTLALSTSYANATLTVGATSVTLTVTGSGITIVQQAGDVWLGNVSGIWDGGALNWVVNGTPSSAYTDGDVVTFDDSGSAVNTISSGATVSPASVTVNTTLNSYTISAVIGGTAGLTKSGSSTLTLTGANTYTGATVVSGGTLSLTGSGSLSASMASLSISNGATVASSVNNSFGQAQVGSWTIAGTIMGIGGGTQTMPANVTLNNGTMSGTGGNAWWGTFLTWGYTTITANGANNTINATTFANYYDVWLNTPLSSDVLNVSSVIGGYNANGGGLHKLGNGTVTLTGASIYLGATTISNGTLLVNSPGSLPSGSTVSVLSGAVLGGNGTIGGTTTANGTIAPGPSVGTLSTLTFGSGLTINGNLVFELNKSLAQSNDVIAVYGALQNTGTGTLTVTNLGPPLVAGDRFTLFNQSLPNGNALTIVGPPSVTFTNNLANDGSITVLTAPVNIMFSVTDNTLNLSWLTSYTGWELQSNSVSLAITNDWYLVPGSTSTNSVKITIDPAKANVFFRMHHP